VNRSALTPLVMLAVACSEQRMPASAVCPSWQSEVATRLQPCTSCHSGAQPAAGYDLTSYLGALGPIGFSIATAGDAGSRLLTRLDPESADVAHQVSAETAALLRQWIVDCELAALDTPLHAHGVLDPASAQFHGVTVAALGWDLHACASCHGDDFAGGTSGASCNGCHRDGPGGCQTCHTLDAATAPRGAQGRQRPYGVGVLSAAHQGHATAGWSCAECHRVPQAWDDVGHVRRGSSVDPAPAEIEFGAAARRDRAVPAYTQGLCSEVYCHGATLRDGAATAPWPTWSGGAEQVRCGGCHGAPPATHASDACAVCHPVDRVAHLNGVVEIGSAPGCSGCHGDDTSAAPPRDLSGAVVSTAMGVGAHRAHLEAPHRLRGPLACSECHQVPAQIDSPGHIDSPAPAEVTALLQWDRGEARCSSAWCHGAARPRWTATGEVTCGSCHGIPPATAAHRPDLPLTSCATCHPRTVDGFGNILVSSVPGGLTSEHINGIVDLQ
jgi:predicted CxxxxCH...CXXCH cytochrome family protein